jgi:uncharacterized lipoprotein
MLKIVRFVFLCCAPALLLACAYSPQIVTIDPEIQVNKSMDGQGRVVSVEAYDRRKDKVLGTQGGVYTDTSGISLADNTEQVLASTVADVFSQMGFSVQPGQQDGLRLTVYLDELYYSSPDVLYSNRVDMRTVITVEAVKGNLKHTNVYRYQGDKRFVLRPDAEDNSKTINMMLSATLQRLFEDVQFMTFIQSP